jgi:hypothetical protein
MIDEDELNVRRDDWDFATRTPHRPIRCITPTPNVATSTGWLAP